MNQILFGVSILLTLSVAGCGSGAEGGKPVFPASGTVKMFGGPLSGATVAFAPTAEGQPTAIGRTDNEGKFVLTTYDYEDGAAEGKYKVVISKSAPVKPTGSSSASGGQGGHEDDPALNSHGASGASGGAEEVDLVPPQYSSSSTTTLTAEVTSSGPNEFLLEIE